MMNMPGLMLIDDDESELSQIHQALCNAAIPSLPVLFNPITHGGLGDIDLTNFSPRVIISDLNLRPGTGSLDANTFYPVISQMLEVINPTKPYVIYFWSTHDDLVEEVMEKVLKVLHVKKIFPPVGYGKIKKSSFLGQSNATALKDKVKQLLTELPIFNAMYDWENRIADAAQETSKSIIQLADNQIDSKITAAERLLEIEKHIDTILSAIGNESIGKDNAKEAPNEAVDLGLMPILEDHLHMMSFENGFWNKALDKIGNRITLPTSTVASLNSFYHTSNLTKSTSKTDKGVMVSLNPELLDGGDAQHKLESKLGISLNCLMHEEFLSNNKLGKSKEEANAFKKEAREATRLGFIELSADCDQAQRKVKLNRYVLCALIPEKYIDLASTHGTTARPRDTAHDGIYKVPFILIDNELFLLKLSFKYQFGTKPSCSVNGLEYENKWFGEPILRLREQILSEISYNCAQYSTRPGIISFR